MIIHIMWVWIYMIRFANENIHLKEKETGLRFGRLGLEKEKKKNRVCCFIMWMLPNIKQ